ncbi:hypothetical protein FIV38_03530 [Pseudomonas proteolytica]|nr:hypothetical protein F4W61_00235 [Pseudomonas proteolytica]TWR85593.1 hypothetical protein FIV38_03530 [Pseudomonas proteolytica]
MLAKNSQAPGSSRKHALSLTFFASKLAPTFDRIAKFEQAVSVTTPPAFISYRHGQGAADGFQTDRAHPG